MGVGAMEDEVIRRAVQGVEKPITVAGKREVVRQYSDVLLMFLLRSHKPEKYCERYRIEHSSDPTPHLDIPVGMDLYDALIHLLDKQQSRR